MVLIITDDFLNFFFMWLLHHTFGQKTRKSLVGQGFINILNFLKGLKCTWIKRYICGAKDRPS